MCSAPGERNSPAGSVSGPALGPDSQISRGRLCSKNCRDYRKLFVGKEQSFNYSNYSRSPKSGSLLGVSGKGLSAAWSQLPGPLNPWGHFEPLLSHNLFQQKMGTRMRCRVPSPPTLEKNRHTHTYIYIYLSIYMHMHINSYASLSALAIYLFIYLSIHLCGYIYIYINVHIVNVDVYN